MNILIAEADPVVRHLLQHDLQQLGHDVVAAETGKQAWQYFQHEDFAAVIADCDMPDMDGLELIRRIRQTETKRPPYITLLTAKSVNENLTQAIEAGADDFLRKPFDRDELRFRLGVGERTIALERNLADRDRRLQRNLDSADRFIRNLLPAPIQAPLLDWRYVPSADLGGDTFGYNWIDDDHFALYLIDVSGRGLESALLSATVLNALRMQTLPNVDFRHPGQVLAALNKIFPMEQCGEKFFTIWYGVYNKTASVLEWSGGGHPDALLFQGQKSPTPVYLKSQGPMLGMMAWPTFESSRHTVRPPARLYVYGDGVHNIHTPDGGMWSFEEFVDFLGETRDADTSPMDQLLDRVRRLHGSEGLEDDFSILEVRF